MVAMSIFFIGIIASKARFASPPPAASASVEHTRGDLPGQAAAVLAPTALTFLAAIADDRVPVPVRLFLIAGGSWTCTVVEPVRAMLARWVAD